MESNGSATLVQWTGKEFLEKATLFMRKTYGAVARKDLWIELRTSFKLLFKLKDRDEYEIHLRTIMEIIKPFQGIQSWHSRMINNFISGDQMGHFVVAAIIGAIEPINKEISTTLARMVKDQMFR